LAGISATFEPAAHAGHDRGDLFLPDPGKERQRDPSAREALCDREVARSVPERLVSLGEVRRGRVVAPGIHAALAKVVREAHWVGGLHDIDMPGVPALGRIR
jgi:hypothetical protein